ncbi:hypothetical protein BDV25DRAFT_136172 [Aspergillus avenaceus]|uniref:Heterokaryon incompatibility domain-containing protein n=1 Tax=Aspergillus avenaceus TaxID=36643 RepID=A0A5N6U6L6_ASPAV|nr:hypothetical protein BDV25DRAFT_136172 [Aspergillus avenaceus]
MRPFQVSIKPETYTVVAEDYYDHALYRQPLGTRAWAFQERLLPPRTLSIGAGELFWDCFHCENASESFPGGLNDTKLPDLQTRFPLETLRTEEFKVAWYTLVEEYTTRELTYPEQDKLFALSAVSTWFERRMNDKFIAGHLRSTFPVCLAWRRNDEAWSQKSQKRKTGPETYWLETISQQRLRVPSWSWASVNVPLLILQMLRVDRTLKFIILTCDILKVYDARSVKDILYPALIIRTYSFKALWDSAQESLVTVRGNKRIPGIVTDEEDRDLTGDTAYYLIQPVTHHYLILERVEMNGMILHRRVGWAHTTRLKSSIHGEKELIVLI